MYSRIHDPSCPCHRYNTYRGRFCVFKPYFGENAPLRGRGRGRGIPTKPRGRGRGGFKGRGNSRNSEPADMRRSHDSVTTRVLSASRNRINSLKNKLEEMQIHMRDLEQENRLYKKLQFRQEKAIRTFEDKENDLPRILDKHSNEIRVLKEQNRRLKEKYDKSDRYLRDAEDELEKTKRRMNKYKSLCEEKDLAERDELSRRLTKAELDMEERDCKIKELERHIEVLKKNHRHEVGIEIARQKEMKKQLEESSQKNSELGSQLKEKEKVIEYQNMYTGPRIAGRSRADSSESPERKPKKKASSMTDLTPRDKAKFYAEKQRKDFLKQKEAKAQQERKKREKWEEEERERKEREKDKERDREREESPTSPPHFSFTSIDKGLEEREEMARREEEERLWKDRERKERQAKENFDKKQKELERRRDQEHQERQEKEEREKRDREERERRERVKREEREKEDRERREREEKDRKEREEKERKERERREKERLEQEERARLEKEKLDNDPTLKEERRKKDELLRKLQAMDQIGSVGNQNSTFNPSSPSRKSKESTAEGFDSPSKRSDPKEYSFTKPINNLHKGKPSHEDVTVPYIERQRHRGKLFGEDDDFGSGYKPSFGPTRGVGHSNVSKSKPLSIFDNDDDEPVFTVPPSNNKTSTASGVDKKSSNLLENLFGPNAAKNSSSGPAANPTGRRGQDSDTFFLTNKSPSPAGVQKNSVNSNNSSTLFPWDNQASSNKTKGPMNHGERHTATIFGGGAALLDDDLSPSNGKILPRRNKQPNLSTFSSKPSIMALDSRDDDIEEVVL